MADDLREAEAHRIAVIQRVIGTVVLVYGEDPSTGGGSGVLIDASGLALTNFHVVEAAGRETATGDSPWRGWAGLADGKLYRWRIVGMDPGGDLALIQLTGRDDFPVAELGDSDAVRPGDRVLAMGNPFNLAEDQSPSVSLGIVSATHRYQGGADPADTLLVYGNCIQVDTSINPGNSGGPLFNMRGRLIGINGRASFEERGRVNVGLGYAITINQARRFLGDLLATKIARHGTLDATFIDHDGKVICNAVDLDRSPLAAHGLLPGDQLVRFNGAGIDSANAYLNELSTLPANWPVEVIWRRGDAEHRASVRLNPVRYTDPPKEEGDQAESPAGKPGEVQDPALNGELAKMLATRNPAPVTESFTDATILGSDADAGGQPVVMIQLDTNDGPRIVQVPGYPPIIDEAPSEETPRDGYPWAFQHAIDSANQRCVKLYGAGLGREHGYATGILVSDAGLILTAIGIYLAGDTITAVLPDGSAHPAKLLRRDDGMQVALLKIDANTPEHFDLTDTSSAQLGDWVIGVSNAFNVASGIEPLGATMGIVSLRADLDTMKRAMDFDVAGDVLLVDAIVAGPGSPGGALVDSDGRLVGMIGKILEAKATRTRLNYAIPADRLAAFVAGVTPLPLRERSAESSRPGEGRSSSPTEGQLPGDLGIRIFTLGGRDAPAYIDIIIHGSPADLAGLKRDDLVLSINDQPVRNVGEYQQHAADLRAGQTVTLLIKRDDEIINISLTAEAAKD